MKSVELFLLRFNGISPQTRKFQLRNPVKSQAMRNISFTVEIDELLGMQYQKLAKDLSILEIE